MTKVSFRAETMVQDFDRETDAIKKIDGVWYAIGYEMLNESNQKYYISTFDELFPIEAKRETRAINLFGMVDSDDNNIFASLGHNKRFYDILEFEKYCPIDGWLKERGFIQYDEETWAFLVSCEHEGVIEPFDHNMMSNFKIVGIQR